MINPLPKARSKIAKSLHRFLERRARRKLAQHHDVWTFLSSTASPSTGCSYSDYWALYSIIRKRKPVEVLELGSGISSVVIALALLDNGRGRLTSMEEDATYADATRTLIPASVREMIDLRHSPSVEKRHGLFVGVGYADIPERQYDFVFVDGPHYERESSYDVDLLKIVERSNVPVTALVDSRAGSCLIYNLFLKKKFYFDYFQNIGFLDAATKDDLCTYREVIVREHSEHAIRRTLIV